MQQLMLIEHSLSKSYKFKSIQQPQVSKYFILPNINRYFPHNLKHYNSHNMDQQKKQNLKHFKITHNQEFLQIQSQLPRFKNQILIDKIHSTIVFEKKQKQFVFDTEPQIKMCSLILGVINIKGSKFIGYVQNVYPQPVLEPENYLIYQIANVNFIPFVGGQKGEEEKIIQCLKEKIFSFGFYFSFSYDMTMRSEIYYSGSANKPIKKFFWNEAMLDALTEGKNIQQWRIPIIQGFYGRFQNFQGKNKLTYYLIGRRSKERSGTRFYSRGIDENGNCSNTIEIEQRIVVGQTIMSCVFLSGSSPIFWEQKSQSKPIKLTRNKELTKGPFVQHIKSLNSEYGNIFLVNLLEAKKQFQKTLIQAYEQIFVETSEETSDFCRYLFYDMNDALKQGNYSSINDLLNHKLQPIISNFGCFIYNTLSKSIQAKQTGIFRVSCLDCLRRTDLFIQAISLKTLYMQLGALGFDPIDFSMNDLMKKNIEDELNSLIKSFGLLWVVKADYESLMYTGTRATSGRKDKLLDGIDNSLVAIQRYYNYEFQDRLKQTAVDFLHPKTNILSHKTTQFTDNFKVSIVAWNVNATEPEKLNLKKIITKFQGADLVVFGVIEMIDLEPTKVVKQLQETELANLWQREIGEKLSHCFGKEKYIFVQKLELVGILLLIFINKDWKNALRSVHKDSVKTGYGGTMGNKGAVVIRVNIYDTSLCFTCAHLSAGQSKTKDRVDDFVQIHKKAFQQSKQSVQNQLQIQQSDHKFFFGDLNFRIRGQFKYFSELMEIVRQNNVEKEKQKIQKMICDFYQRDQLLTLRMQSDTPYFISFYEEQKIRFLPTYKLEKHTGFYTFEKNRNPSWCDRILYWTDSLEDHSCQCTQYTAINVLGSDHRPVLGKFVVTVIKQEPKRDSLRDFGEQIVGKEFRDSYFE